MQDGSALAYRPIPLQDYALILLTDQAGAADWSAAARTAGAAARSSRDIPTWLSEVVLHNLRIGAATATIRFWRG